MPAVTETAIQRKLLNRQSRRDIEREVQIALRGGEAIEIVYGLPLSDEERKERMDYAALCLRPSITERIKNEVVKDKQKRKRNRRLGADRTEKDVILRILQTAKIRAKTLGIPFTLKAEELSIPSVCPVFNTPLIWTDNITDDTPSLDRLIPDRGYVKDNVEFISYKANRIKSNANLAEIEAVALWLRNKNIF